MKIKLLATLAALGISGNALAATCTPDLPPNYQAERLDTPDTLIELRADALVAPDTPIGKTIASKSLSQNVEYICDTTILYGNRPIIGLTPYPGYPNMYKTNIEGIGVKFTASFPDGSSARELPRFNLEYRGETIPEGGSRYVAVPGRFNASFYKLSDNISLNTKFPQQTLLFDAGTIGHNSIENAIVSTYYMNQVHIISTPVCTVDNPLPVDFGTVNADNVRSGVAKPFQFGIVCKTDYNSYNVTASIKGNKITADGKYIKVSDIKNNDDSLIIEITDDQKKPVMVDNSTKIDITNLKSGQKANFGWTANLKKQDGKPYPAQGKFTASAIITLDIK
ncbi:fimbrial protein [Morganella sp. Je.2.23]|uniref:fimbrial protein n=1 Tax=Morganella sp. Je.2.23 TaxID=3142840 RepID=UPI003DA99AF3